LREEAASGYLHILLAAKTDAPRLKGKGLCGKGRRKDKGPSKQIETVSESISGGGCINEETESPGEEKFPNEGGRSLKGVSNH